MRARTARSIDGGERRLTWTWLAVLALCPAVVGAAWFVLWQRPLERRDAELAHELAQATLPLESARWQRPVLRGVARSGNAAALARNAVVPARVLPSGVDLFEALDSDPPPSPELARLIERIRPRLDAFEAATQSSFSWQLDPALDPSTGTLDNLAHLDSVELLLLRASTLSAAACLRAATDAVRLAQDLVPGGGLDRVQIAGVEMSVVPRVAIRCAARASPDELGAALAEVESLAEHAPPIASAIDVEALVAARGFQSDFALRPSLPKLTGAPLDRARANPWQLLDAWQRSLDAAERLSRLDSGADYVAQRAALDRALDSHWQDDPLLVASRLRVEAEKVLARHARAVALLRALGGALAVMQARATNGALPRVAPSALAQPALADPFSQAPLRYERAADGRSGRVYSVGMNGRDDAGRGDDVVVQVPR
jgi:hypothetical protein